MDEEIGRGSGSFVNQEEPEGLKVFVNHVRGLLGFFFLNAIDEDRNVDLFFNEGLLTV